VIICPIREDYQDNLPFVRRFTQLDALSASSATKLILFLRKLVKGAVVKGWVFDYNNEVLHSG